MLVPSARYVNEISDWVTNLFSLIASLRFSVSTKGRQDNIDCMGTEMTALHNTLILQLENRALAQSENGRRMQDRSAIKCHSGFALVERQTWFTFAQKWHSAGTNGTSPVTQTHILDSAQGAGFCTRKGLNIFKLLIQSFQAFTLLCKNSLLPNRQNWQKTWVKDFSILTWQFSFGSVSDQFWDQILKMSYWKHAVSSPEPSLLPWPGSCRHWITSGCSQILQISENVSFQC